MDEIMDKIKNAQIRFKVYYDNQTGKRIVILPDTQLVDSFFVARSMIVQDSFELQPLTLGRFIKACILNSSIEWRWNILRLLWKRGFIEPTEGCEVDWRKDWHWDTQNVLERRVMRERSA